MAEEVNRLKIGMEGLAKAYGKSELAARKMLAQFGMQVDIHSKISAGLRSVPARGRFGRSGSH